jgi:hypothetical protein
VTSTSAVVISLHGMGQYPITWGFRLTKANAEALAHYAMELEQLETAREKANAINE